MVKAAACGLGLSSNLITRPTNKGRMRKAITSCEPGLNPFALIATPPGARYVKAQTEPSTSTRICIQFFGELWCMSATATEHGPQVLTTWVGRLWRKNILVSHWQDSSGVYFYSTCGNLQSRKAFVLAALLQSTPTGTMKWMLRLGKKFFSHAS